jgi:ABC-type antimicrobial peptide transport system permease subunit
MLVIRSLMGTKKTVVFVLLVMVMATISGLIFGAFACPGRPPERLRAQSSGDD